MKDSVANKITYDVIIVGGGITGASILYLLSNYSDLKNVLLIEKYGDLASLNSNASNNAQTLHTGDIETNYTLEHSKQVKEASERIIRYTDSLELKERNSIIKNCQKMVLAVDDEEINILNKNYDSGLGKLYPGLKKIRKKQLEKLEPNVVKKRDPNEKVFALLSDNGHMVDFGRLTHSFVQNSKKHKILKTNVLLNTKVLSIRGNDGKYIVKTNKDTHHGKFVIFASGTYSLYFAKSLGYDKNLSILSVGGGFYTAPRVLRGKVYRVQIGGIPFAAIHGDPDFNNKNIVRFGPTVTIPPLLERHHLETFADYIKSFDFDLPTMISLKRILLNKDIRRIISRNMLYGVPVIGKPYFLKMEAARIVPSLKSENLKFNNNLGGIRPQIIDENKKSLLFGAGKIKEEGLIFNITPSPGASSCLQSALEDVVTVTRHLNKNFNVDRFEKELGPIESKNILNML